MPIGDLSEWCIIGKLLFRSLNHISNQMGIPTDPNMPPRFFYKLSNEAHETNRGGKCRRGKCPINQLTAVIEAAKSKSSDH